MIHLTYYPYCAFVQLPHFPLQEALRSQYRPQQFIFILSLMVIISGVQRYGDFMNCAIPKSRAFHIDTPNYDFRRRLIKSRYS